MILKTVGVLVAGIFVGAVAMEIVRKKRPDILDKFYTDTRRMTRGIKAAFKEAYKSVPEERETDEAPD